MFQGSYVALVTPFDSEGRIDEDAYRALIRRQIKAGTRGLVPCGSTGEAATLTHEEFRRALEIALEESRGDVPVMAGVASNATWKAVELAREAESLGADALLVLSPYYNKPTQEGLRAHFAAVARETRLPVMLYNIPGRCGVNAAPATIARVAKDFPNVVAVKEAAGSLDQVSEILALTPSSFTVMSGDDSLTLPMMAVGARGVVSVLANVAPKETQALCGAFARGDVKKARALHLKSFPLVKALFVETNPIPVKAALGMMG
ncbi:MAG TPA: 4-hydroxy-tetrahydrodipicolinate synthase, partial [Elusimicrobiota bacterium]|nr:4-hydroxy-tetrahydrodipicolinate synthase [Elusimicrobiota bacterium]